MRVGLCGLGEIGQHHLRAIAEAPQLELAAVCDLDQALARASAGEAVPYTDLGRMLERERLDAVDVCLPHSLHEGAAVAALRAGCHVLLEKPLAVDLAACDAIAAVAAEEGLRVAVSHNQLFYAPHRRLLELLEAGELGALRAAYARLWIGGRYGGWREDPAVVGGGLLMDAGIHRVYCLRAIGGPVSAVRAKMDRPRAEESFVLTLEFASGAVGVAQGSYHGPQGTFDDRLDVLCADGAAEVAGCEAFFEGDLRDVPQLRVKSGGAWREEEVEGSWEASVRDSVRRSLAAIAAGEEPPVGLQAARETVALVEAAYRSAESGAPFSPAELEGAPAR
jgi:UDP-N-acetylglucosamine 3-dehydrogenase